MIYHLTLSQEWDYTTEQIEAIRRALSRQAGQTVWLLIKPRGGHVS